MLRWQRYLKVGIPDVGAGTGSPRLTAPGIGPVPCSSPSPHIISLSQKQHRVSLCNCSLALPPSSSFPSLFLLPIVTSAMTTEKIHPESPEEFEFIETPPASCITPAEPCGVRTTSVSFVQFVCW